MSLRKTATTAVVDDTMGWQVIATTSFHANADWKSQAIRMAWLLLRNSRPLCIAGTIPICFAPPMHRMMHELLAPLSLRHLTYNNKIWARIPEPYSFPTMKNSHSSLVLATSIKFNRGDVIELYWTRRKRYPCLAQINQPWLLCNDWFFKKFKKRSNRPSRFSPHWVALEKSFLGLKLRLRPQSSKSSSALQAQGNFFKFYYLYWEQVQKIKFIRSFLIAIWYGAFMD